MFSWWKPRNEVRTPDYTLRLKSRFRELVDVIYREGDREFVFAGELVGKTWRQINISLPNNLSGQDIQRMVPRLAAALTKLRHEFVISKICGIQVVSETEQAAAFAKIREMGYELEVDVDGSQLKLTKGPNWEKPGAKLAKERALQLMRMMNAARGKRARVEILAKSDSAEVDSF
jgi:hypothetical protein